MAQGLAEPIRDAGGPPVGNPSSLPPDVEAELQALARLNDDVLWAVARSRMQSARQRRWRRLLEKTSGMRSPMRKGRIWRVSRQMETA